jgi:hypothetical protein
MTSHIGKFASSQRSAQTNGLELQAVKKPTGSAASRAALLADPFEVVSGKPVTLRKVEQGTPAQVADAGLHLASKTKTEAPPATDDSRVGRDKKSEPFHFGPGPFAQLSQTCTTAAAELRVEFVKGTQTKGLMSAVVEDRADSSPTVNGFTKRAELIAKALLSGIVNQYLRSTGFPEAVKKLQQEQSKSGARGSAPPADLAQALSVVRQTLRDEIAAGKQAMADRGAEGEHWRRLADEAEAEMSKALDQIVADSFPDKRNELDA